MSGSTRVADAVVLGEAAALALGEAVGLALGETSGLAEAEALEAALVAALSSTALWFIPLSSKPLSSAPRACIPLSSKPRSSVPRECLPLSSTPPSSPWAAATGAKTDTANAADKTSNNHLRIVSPSFRLYIHEKDAPPRFV